MKDFSRDIRDIEYFIDHVQDLNARVDVLEKMGYRIGVNIVSNKMEDVEKKITIGKRGEYRIQITPKLKGIPLSKCVILEK